MEKKRGRLIEGKREKGGKDNIGMKKKKSERDGSKVDF